MAGERDLEKLLAGMRPIHNPGEYVFCTTPTLPTDLKPVATMTEAEGVSLVLRKEDADRYRLSYEYVAAWITLQIHSALEAVGLTAAVSRRLTDEGISCNVVAGYHHDHLFVAVEDADRTLRALSALSS